MLQLQTLCQNEKLWYYWYTRKLLRTFFRVRRIDQTNLKKLGLLFVGFSSFLKLFLCVYYGHLMTNGIETDNCRKTFLYSFLQKEKLNQFVNYCAQLLQNWNSKPENHTLNHLMFQFNFLRIDPICDSWRTINRMNTSMRKQLLFQFFFKFNDPNVFQISNSPLDFFWPQIEVNKSEEDYCGFIRYEVQLVPCFKGVYCDSKKA